MHTAHQAIEAYVFAQDFMNEFLGDLLIPPPGDAFSQTAKAVPISLYGAAPSGPIVSPLSSIPYNEPGSLLLDYIYTDNLGYEAHGRECIRGSFDRYDLALLLSALYTTHTAGFIPHQIGLPDLHERLNGSQFTWTDADHPWHRATSLQWLPSYFSPHSWQDIRNYVVDVLTNGFDEENAVEWLQSSHAE